MATDGMDPAKTVKKKMLYDAVIKYVGNSRELLYRSKLLERIIGKIGEAYNRGVSDLTLLENLKKTKAQLEYTVKYQREMNGRLSNNMHGLCDELKVEPPKSYDGLKQLISYLRGTPKEEAKSSELKKMTKSVLMLMVLFSVGYLALSNFSSAAGYVSAPPSLTIFNTVLGVALIGGFALIGFKFFK